MHFAIVVPIGAYHDLLPQCLASLEAQTERLSVALMDASGDPRVGALADQFDGLITYRQHGSDNGQADAIRNGWNALDGDVLGWLNADDILYPDSLSRVAQKIADDAADVVYGHSTIIDEEFRWTGWQYGVEPPSARLGHASIISQPSCFFKRSSYNQAGGINAGLHYTMDWDLFVNLYNSGSRFSFLNDALSMVLWANETKTASFNSQRIAELRRMIRRTQGDLPEWKIITGFFLQNIIDRAPFKLRSFLLGNLRKSNGQVFGWSADGTLGGRFQLPLVHFNQEAKEQVHLTFAGPASIRSAEIEGLSCSIQNNQTDCITLTPEQELPGGKRLELSVGFTASRGMRLKDVRLS